MLAWLAQVDLRQHLQTRDFFPDDVSELSSVAAVEDAVDGGGATDFVVVVVVAVVRIGCRQQDEEDTDVDAATVVASTVLALEVAAAGAGDFTVFTGSFLLVPCTAVFNIFSSPSAVGPCRAATIVHRGHSPTLKGCSSLL